MRRESENSKPDAAVHTAASASIKIINVSQYGNASWKLSLLMRSYLKCRVSHCEIIFCPPSPRSSRAPLLVLEQFSSKDVRLSRLAQQAGETFTAVKPDIVKYMPMLEAADLTHDEKLDVIHALWHVMDALTDRAFGLNPAQQIEMSVFRKFAGSESDLVSSQVNPNAETCNARHEATCTEAAESGEDNKR